jgi:hypothetical protein
MNKFTLYLSRLQLFCGGLIMGAFIYEVLSTGEFNFSMGSFGLLMVIHATITLDKENVG